MASRQWRYRDGSVWKLTRATMRFSSGRSRPATPPPAAASLPAASPFLMFYTSSPYCQGLVVYSDGRLARRRSMATLTSAANDPGPSLSRRHAAGAASARGLLFTVLGEFVLPAGGSAWTSAFIEAFGRLGVEEKAIRQALARTAADGWIRPERHGRRTRWWLTPDGDRLLTDGTERIYAFASSQRDWDGSWLLVLARVPETDRPTRHLLRTRLSWAGLGSPAPSVWITTHTERQAEAEQVLRQTGVTGGQIFVARHQG